jgi:hypothetical protein
MAKEKMDFRFALFNCHVNNAEDRAYAALDAQNPAWAAEVRQMVADGNGVMAILKKPPTDATKEFVTLVMNFVNEDCE